MYCMGKEAEGTDNSRSVAEHFGLENVGNTGLKAWPVSVGGLLTMGFTGWEIVSVILVLGKSLGETTNQETSVVGSQRSIAFRKTTLAIVELGNHCKRKLESLPP